MNSCTLKLFFILFVLPFCNLSFAQETKNDLSFTRDSLSADSIIQIGQGFYGSNNIDSAIIYCRLGAERFKKINVFGRYIGGLNDVAYIYYNEKEYLKFSEITKKTYEEAVSVLGPNNLYRISAFNNMQVLYYSRGDYEKATDIAKEVLNLNIKNNGLKSEIISSYFNVGTAFKQSGDYKSAVNYAKKALDILKDTLPNSPSIADTYQDIGIMFKIDNQIDSALHYFEKAEELLKPIQNNSPKYKIKIKNFLGTAELWNEKNNIVLANSYIDKASKFVPNDFYTIRLEEVRGKVLLTKGAYKEAIKSFKQAQAFADKSKKRNTPPYKSKRYIELAKAYEGLGDFDKTLSAYQEALKTISPSFYSDQYTDNPMLDQILDKPDALNILDNKARVLYKAYLKNKKQDYLLATYNTYVSSTNLIRDFRQGILTTDSKKALSEKNIQIYEGAIRTALDLYAQTGDRSYQASAFSLAESNKALLLLESINEQSAKSFADIPSELIAQEKDLKVNLAYLQKDLIEKKSANLPTKAIEGKIFDIQHKLDLFTNALEKNYPRYFDLKYKNEPSNLSEIQQSLKGTNKAFLEYFVGETYIYLFIVTKDLVDIQLIKNEAFVRQNVEAFRSILNNAPDAGFGQEEYRRFLTTAHNLYQQLIEPAVNQLDDKTIDWVIIPDYYLNYIPFDIFLRSKGDTDKSSLSAKAMDYLFEDFNLSYDYSVTLHLKNQNRASKDFKHDFVGFAPSFKDTRQISARTCSQDELYSLQCSEKEISSIADLTNGKEYFGSKANRASFEDGIQDYKIIHLATHACVDEQDSKLNKIFLTDDYLSDFDLYNMKLNAKLAVLSACNTGSGKLIKGEGVMSLARGFINAGCSSTLISMWSVDDCATSDIMLYFYEGLKTGLSKEKALKAAKIKYLESVNKTKMHPYYWAAFVPFGDMEAIELGEQSNQLYYWLAIGLALLLFLFIFFRKK